MEFKKFDSFINEGKLTEANKFNMVSAKFKDALDDASEISTDSVKKLIKKFKEKRPDAAMEYAKQACGWMFKESKLNELSYVIIDPRGNPSPVGSKPQGDQAIRKKGGNRAGWFVVLQKNAKAAQKLVGKYGGNVSKYEEKMWDSQKERDTQSDQVVNNETKMYDAQKERDILNEKIYSGYEKLEIKLNKIKVWLDSMDP